VCAGRSGEDALDAWDAELARHGVELMHLRAEAVASVAPRFASHAAGLGLPEQAAIVYAPRSRAAEPAELRTELGERRGSDLERGFTAHGPHRDEIAIDHGAGSLRAYGSQGQQRTGLLALLFAERDVLLERGDSPLMLLDDVTSELDTDRRDRLGTLVREGGQVVLSATEPGHVPGGATNDVDVVEVAHGRLSMRPEAHSARLAAA
jgi:DNA replication and repair protein RecF